MSARIEMLCTRCSAKIVTSSVQEAIAWDTSHAAVCLGPAPSDEDAS